MPTAPRFVPSFSRLPVAACVAVMVALGGCSTTSPDVIKPGDAQRLSQVADAVVLSVRPVVVEGSQSGLGGATGAVVGGIAGSTASSHNKTAVVAAVLGAVVGGVVGNATERFGTREDAYEILLQMPNGERRAIVQAEGGETFKPGDPVILVTTAGKTRVMLAPRVAAPAAPTAPALSR
ncbi:MAG: glycine zipper 2TM domain-containing protein [Burkholderiales bacterium]|nr:glycine zipper 2TM domain-containing protein [Burkholderiales bacterium]MBH2016280.1 glycine zipper 2TM domain-containing protein [Burkholderiales bacterium]